MKKDENLSWQDPLSRFIWIDNNRIKLMNREGIETIIDTSNVEFKELAYNKRFYAEYLLTGYWGIYQLPPYLDVN